MEFNQIKVYVAKCDGAGQRTAINVIKLQKNGYLRASYAMNDDY